MEGPPLDDAELVERAKRGEVAAFEELVRGYQAMAVRTAYLVTGETGDAEDAAQNAFLKAYAALARFDPGRPFRPWLLRIVVNEAKNRRRWRRRHPELELDDVHAPPAAAPSLEDRAEAQERRAVLLRAVNGLREGDRLAIAYRFFLELSEAEMAEALGVARGTVKSRLSRALGRLRAALVREGIPVAEAEAVHE
ncbi:MAG: RNA polymerase sigma factor [Actinomycetota bacterium]